MKSDELGLPPELERFLEPVVLPVDGKVYKEVDPETSTIERDVHLMRLIREAGLDGLAIDLEDEVGTHKAMLGMLDRVLTSGRLFDLLGGMLTPDGAEWTPELAVTTAAQLKRVSDPAVKRAMYDAVTKMLIGFLLAAIGPSTPSPNSSGKGNGAVAAKKQRKPGAKGQIPLLAEGPSTAETSSVSSDSSPEATIAEPVT